MGLANMRKATVKLFGSLSDYLPAKAKANAVPIDLTEGTTIGTALAQLHVPEKLCHLVLLDGVFIPPSRRMKEVIVKGDVISVWPPVSGG